jgi:Phosphodiester glycosidase
VTARPCRVRRIVARTALALLALTRAAPAVAGTGTRAAAEPTAASMAAAGHAFRYTGARRVWPGVVFRTFQTTGSGGPVLGVLLDVDLGDPHVTVGLLHPPAVAARQPVSRMAAARHAVAGVNGDFFNIGENHPGVRPTGAAVGPEVADGHALKAAVPDAQRFGPRPAPGATTEEVIGVGYDRTARMTTLHLTGTISVHGPLAPAPIGPPQPNPRPNPTPPAGPPGAPPGSPAPPKTSDPGDDGDAGDDGDDREDAAGDRADARAFGLVRHPVLPDALTAGRRRGVLAARPAALPAAGAAWRRAGLPRPAPVGDGSLSVAVRGLNQYALPVGGVGVFTGHWGSASRLRAVCGTDLRRHDPCTGDAAEVTVRRGLVTRVSDGVGGGPIPADTTVLVGREAGADTLRRLRPGDRVRVAYRLAGPVRLRSAVGGFPILRAGRPPAGLDATVRAARTAAGVSRDGRHLYLVVAESHSARSTGLTLANLAVLLRLIGAHDAMNLDGGGSSTFTLRTPGEKAATLRNLPSAGHERAVANGIGVFVHL